MPDFPPPNVAAELDPPGPEALSEPAIEAILADFRAWLSEAKDAPPVCPSDESVPFDVSSFLQQFIALRQEVNLQTRSSRAQLEQNAQSLALLQESLGSLQRQQEISADGAEADLEEQLKAPLKALIEAHDALVLAEREVKRLLSQPVSQESGVAPELPRVWIPYWARWLGLGELIEKQLEPLKTWHASLAAGQNSPVSRHRQALDAVLVGYTMSRQRLERAIEQQDLEPIDCVGQPFDPETMEVAEVIREEGRTSTEVLEVLRRGYLWKNRVFRCAQVRVARP